MNFRINFQIFHIILVIMIQNLNLQTVLIIRAIKIGDLKILVHLISIRNQKINKF